MKRFAIALFSTLALATSAAHAIEYNQVQADKLNALERVSQQTATILSVLRRYQAQSNMQAASSRLQATLGMEPVIEGSDSMPLPELTQAVGKSLQSWDAGQFQ